MVERFGDAYVAVGPWLLSEGNADRVLDPDPAFDDCSDNNHTSKNNLAVMSGENIGDL